MKNNTVNTLAYTGIVTLSQYVGNKKVKFIQKHNDGGAPLFDFLYECLIGNFDVAKRNRPTKIMLLTKKVSVNEENAEVVHYENAALDWIYLRSQVKKSDNSVIYSFIIGRDQLKDIQFDHIGLYSEQAESLDDYSAICEIGELDRNISLSAALVVDWQLKITN